MMKKIQSDKGVSHCLASIKNPMNDDVSWVMRYRIMSEVGKKCATGAEGHRLFLEIWHDLAVKSIVQLDFAGVTCFSQTFFDALYGELLKYFRLSFLDQKIHIQNLSRAGREMLQSTFRRAKESN